jgi:hypothetical protein
LADFAGPGDATGLFVAAIGDLHLKSTATQAIDQVAVRADALLDYDGQSRPSGSKGE